VPVLAKLKTVTGRIWTYVRDDRPFGGRDPPAAMFYYSRNRAGDHPREHLAGYAGIMQARKRCYGASGEDNATIAGPGGWRAQRSAWRPAATTPSAWG
jgi:hypothetical protein